MKTEYCPTDLIIEREKAVLREVEAALLPSILAPYTSDDQVVRNVEKLIAEPGVDELLRGRSSGVLDQAIRNVRRILKAPTSAAEKINELWTLLDDEELCQMLAPRLGAREDAAMER
jgi:hypothetical protein